VRFVFVRDGLIEEGVGVDDVCFVFFDDFIVRDVCRDCIVGKDKVFGLVAFGKGGFDVRNFGGHRTSLYNREINREISTVVPKNSRNQLVTSAFDQ
jgi:hypothetical protein